MQKRLQLIALAATIAASGPALAAGSSPSTEEHIGVGSGLVVGALAGGPVGAVIGAAIGAKLGDTLHRRGESIDVLTSDLEQSRARTSELEENVDRLVAHNRALDASLDQLRQTARPELVSLLEAGIEMDLLFRTDEDVLGAGTEDRLTGLAATLAAMPGLGIRLDGYSDERGDEQYNQRLSERRAEHVRDLLVAGGVPSGRIRVHAHGESPSATADADGFALERRVSLTLTVDADRSYAANPADSTR